LGPTGTSFCAIADAAPSVGAAADFARLMALAFGFAATLRVLR
jgi:hypothetical protein